MKPTRKVFTSLTVKDDAGKELLSLEDDLVSVQLPLQPAFVNPGFYPALEANLWRHKLSKWYDDELVLLDDLRRDGANYAADNLEVLLYGTFAKTAEQMGRRQLLRKSAYPKFKQSFNAFLPGVWASTPMSRGWPLSSRRAFTNRVFGTDRLQLLHGMAHFIVRFQVKDVVRPGRNA